MMDGISQLTQVSCSRPKKHKGKKMTTILKIVLPIFFCLISLHVQATPAFKLVDLGLFESDHSEVNAINDNGQLVGFYTIQGKKIYFIWDQSEGISLLNFPKTSTVKVINNSGQIAGEFLDSKSCVHGFMWDRSLGFSDIGTLGGNVHVVGMNDLGQIVGHYELEGASFVNENSTTAHAFMWEKGVIHDLGTLIGDMGLPGDYSYAVGINNNGVIIGSSTSAVVHKGKITNSEQIAVIWRNNLIEEFDSTYSGTIELQSINDNGLVTCFKKSIAEKGLYVVDLTSMKDWQLGNWSESKIRNNNMVLSYQHNNLYSLKLTSNGDYTIHHPQRNAGVINMKNVFNEMDSDLWDEFIGICDFNSNSWVVASVSNVFGEQHSLVFVPQEGVENEHEDSSDSHDELSEVEELQRILIMYGNNKDGYSTLHYAIKMGDVRAVNLLLQNGAHVDARDNGIPALVRAVTENQLDIARVLLEKGADVHRRVEGPNSDWYWGAIHYAAEKRDADFINLLAKYGADVNCRLNPTSTRVETPLHIAAKIGNYDAVVALVILGADVNANSAPSKGHSVNHWRESTPLAYAAHNLKYADNPKNLDLIKFLVENGGYRNVSLPQLPCTVIKGYLESVHR